MWTKSNLLFVVAVTFFALSLGLTTAGPAPAQDLCFVCLPYNMQPGNPEVCTVRPFGRTVCTDLHGDCCLAGGYCYPLM